MSGLDSVFLAVPLEEHIAGNRLAFAIWDRFPVSPGHALVITRRLVPDWWSATPEERLELLALVDIIREEIARTHSPAGYNIGFNVGAAAGQTVSHLHIHVIPRYVGDVADPAGGIRNVIPGKGNYLFGPSYPHGVGGDQGGVELFDGEDRPLELELVRRLRDPIFDRIDLAVSFIMRSGLQRVDELLQDALERDARIRILTTSYMRITEHGALARLLDLANDSVGRLQVRVFEDDATSFHPKAYLFWSSRGDLAAGIVGSSNLSRSGLADGIEWNLATGAAGALLGHFTKLWEDARSRPLTAEWLRGYASPVDTRLAPIVELEEAPVQPVEPRPIQREALTALEQTRLNGHRAGLVVMATGLGKTWLAAFDTARPQFRRVLFVAHREEILRQSRDVFRQVQPDGDLGLYFGGEKKPEATMVFASVQTLVGRLSAFNPSDFDYIVIDEFHHAAAPSYRKIIDYFEPQFLLGLTATPERMDGADLLALCGDNLVYECDLVEGIRRSELVPFNYWGVPDPVDFEPIPWRNGRFDTEGLTEAVETTERAESAFAEWQDHCGSLTLAFCVSIRHADFMADFFRARGIRAAAVHTGASSAPRHEALDQLQQGELQVLFAVDLFNEGLDVPYVDTVLMLRPTESPVVFLQQLGRGLRTADQKKNLQVVDFIGNHRSFFLKPRTLLSLGDRGTPSTAAVLAALDTGDFGLPPGCSVAYDLEAVELLRRMAKLSGKAAIDEYCRSHYEEEGLRPSAAQTFRAGYNPASVRTRHGGWFGYLEHLGLASDSEQAILDVARDVLNAFEAEPVTKSFKLIVLRALLHDGALRDGATVAQISATSRQLIDADPRLRRDVTEFDDLDAISAEAFEEYWRKWPIAAWAGELRGGQGHWFRLSDDRLEPTFRISSNLGEAFDAMVAEIVEYRLARYLTGKDEHSEEGWLLNVSHADGRPILFLQRERNRGLPEGKAEFVAEGRQYVGNFVKVAMNVAELPGQPGNALHALLRGWFGPSAGHPGTQHQVRLQPVDGALVMRPVEPQAATPAADIIPLFASYKVACGAFETSDWAEHTAGTVEIRRKPEDAPLNPAREFVCFARGDSMDGGPEPIRHGDPLLFEWVEGGSARDYVNQRVLVEQAGPGGTAPALKVLHHVGASYELASANPSVEPVGGQSSMTIAARLIRRLSQPDVNGLDRHIGDTFKRQDIPPLYGVEHNPGNWQSGHVSLLPHVILFVTLTKSDAMAWGAEYIDHFEGPERFVWSSQTSTGPDGKKGREIIDALENGTWIHLWARQKKTDIAFTYCGLIVPLSHHGARPMSVTFRLLTPLADEIWKRLRGPTTRS